MNIDSLLADLRGPDPSAAYRRLRELEAIATDCDALYPHVRDVAELAGAATNAERIRGFRLLCLQARWDRDDLLGELLPPVLSLVDDQRPTTVRQALRYLRHVIVMKPSLTETVMNAVEAIDTSRFKADTMRPLIERDIADLRNAVDTAN